MAKDIELLEVEEKLPSEKNEKKAVRIEKKPKDKEEPRQKDQLIALGFIICIAFLITLAVFTAINTKAVDKLTERIDAMSNGNYGGNGGGTPETPEATSYSTDDFKIIKPSDIKKESKNKTIVVLWARQSCGYCVAYAPIITEVAKKHNVTIRYIDMEQYVDMNTWEPSNVKEYQILADLTGDGEFEGYGAQIVEGTPGTMFIRDNKVIDGIIGYTEQAEVEAHFLRAGL
jgi:thiol-disulfide isomerase/thioredoxin